ncbi:MAG: hypothetical protein A3G76_12695 [Acidobacteria bacterium RIFCSPLOWO2_12_FULL_65_11]|nr:MAG: hypothetical protein A3H95_06370 [Acidobacteria bacterium RIFCSPLOWO2_02_FULL_64_15]OFW31600.1 MAG: hypothetical protein A3G76_12695 [Acidobacteria bacterium RIFCSPLOWO2_12_FULL_65_11]
MDARRFLTRGNPIKRLNHERRALGISFQAWAGITSAVPESDWSLVYPPAAVDCCLHGYLGPMSTIVIVQLCNAG